MFLNPGVLQHVCIFQLLAKSDLKHIKKHYVCNVFLMYFRYVDKPSFPLEKQAFPDNAKCDGETLIRPVVYEMFWGTFQRIAFRAISLFLPGVAKTIAKTIDWIIECHVDDNRNALTSK